MADPIRLYTPREAAALLKVHQRTVLRWVESGKLAARRIGRQIRIEERTLRTLGEPAAAPQAAKPPGPSRPRKAGSQRSRRGSPAALLRHCGRISEEDARAMLRAIRQAHILDWEEHGEVSA